MNRTLASAILFALGILSLFACANKEKQPLTQPAAAHIEVQTISEEEPVLPWGKPTFAFLPNPEQKTIDRLKQEIAELEESYPPVSARWPSNIPAFVQKDETTLLISSGYIQEQQKLTTHMLKISSRTIQIADLEIRYAKKRASELHQQLKEESQKLKAEMKTVNRKAADSVNPWAGSVQ